MNISALIESMRLRTLLLSLAGVILGGIIGYSQSHCSPWTLVFLFLTTACLQILTNLGNELGDHISGVDEERVGPRYGMEHGLTEKQMFTALNVIVVLCALFGLAMLLFSFDFSIFDFRFWGMLALGAAAIWAATHYTLGKKPYGYRGWGDISVFIFFGLTSVLGSYFVATHTLDWAMVPPAVGMGLLSVGVLNVNNVRDMSTDEGLRRTVPLRIGEKWAKIYQFALVVGGMLCFITEPRTFFAWPFLIWHLYMVRTRSGKDLDPALPLLVVSTFLLAVLFTWARYGL